MSAILPNTGRVVVNGRGFAMWMHSANSRNELRNLGDRELRDIGLCRAQARWEAANPFWVA
jgi:uncharacterized protein YjiS (DUF1127 family)